MPTANKTVSAVASNDWVYLHCSSCTKPSTLNPKPQSHSPVHHDTALSGVQVTLPLLAGVGVGGAARGALDGWLADAIQAGASGTCRG
jgi:hypothetical protein